MNYLPLAIISLCMFISALLIALYWYGWPMAFILLVIMCWHNIELRINFATLLNDFITINVTQQIEDLENDDD